MAESSRHLALQSQVLGIHVGNTEVAPEGTAAVDAEVHKYHNLISRRGEHADPDARDPLLWWYKNRKVYPHLYPLACRALTVAGTAVKSE